MILFKVNKKMLGLVSALNMSFLPEALARPTLDEPVVDLAPDLALARTLFRRHDYGLALASLSSFNSDQALLIAGESSFRQGQYEAAKDYFSRLQLRSTDAVEKKKLQVRLFEIDLLSGDLTAALNQYESFSAPPAIMAYGLGKALFDAQEEAKASKVLGSIQPNSEFYLRASYILASIEIGKKSFTELIKLFKAIEDSPIISVEDHTVHDLAILAQGRLSVDDDNKELAQSAYERIATKSYYFPTATYELASFLNQRAEQARLGLGRYKDVAESVRSFEEEKNEAEALKVIHFFRKYREIDWQNPDLFALMAELLVKSKRYADASIAYDKLFAHYERIREQVAKDTRWPVFDLAKPGAREAVLDGVPAEFLSSREIKELLKVKDQLKASRENLLRLEELFEGGKNQSLEKALALQQSLEQDFYELSALRQKELSAQLVARLDEHLAKPAFRRAELIARQMRDIKKQLGVVREFQTKQINEFESSLKAIDEGGAQ